MARPLDRHVGLNGLRFHYLDWGTRGAQPLLLVHGGAQTAHSWDEVAPDLSRDHDVVALDQRGHGDTEWAAPGRYRRADFVGDLAAMLEHLGWESATLMALSLGGLNALALAAEQPARVRGLVLVDIVPSPAREGTDAIRAQLMQHEFASLDDAVALMHRFNPRRSLENIRERAHHGMRQLPDGRWTYKFDYNMAAGAADADALWPSVRRLACPTLLVRGGESLVLTDEGADRFRHECPGAEVAVVPGAGHSVMGDNPAGFLAAVRPFLARHGL
ncbi:MAG: alpha/beta hydrolase [Candidatus Binatia bacterium]